MKDLPKITKKKRSVKEEKQLAKNMQSILKVRSQPDYTNKTKKKN